MVTALQINERRHIVKVTNISDVNKFCEVLDQCEGKVELVTKRGDCLNLCSKISQFAAVEKMITDSSIQQGEIVSYNKRDAKRIKQFMNKL